MSELNIQFVIADGTIQIKDQVSKEIVCRENQRFR